MGVKRDVILDLPSSQRINRQDFTVLSVTGLLELSLTSLILLKKSKYFKLYFDKDNSMSNHIECEWSVIQSYVYMR